MFNTDSERRFQNTITERGGLIISEATLKTSDLLDAAYSVLFPNGLNTELCHELEVLLTDNDADTIDYGDKSEDADWLWNETIFNYFNEIAPDGYYFRCSEGDRSCIGWFAYEDE